jgi:hypothetical protein
MKTIKEMRAALLNWAKENLSGAEWIAFTRCFYSGNDQSWSDYEIEYHYNTKVIANYNWSN